MKYDKKENIKRSVLIIIIMIIALLSIISSREKRAKKNKEKDQVVEVVGNYNVDIIKASYNKSNKTNYLISPYNIELALNMLRDGTSGKTKEEIDKVIGNRKINDLGIKNIINIANGVFIKNEYQNDIKNDYTKGLKDKYQAEIIYDEYKTPKVINDWVKKNTNGMIDKILDDIDEEFVLGLASALAIDTKWTNQFECDKTREEEFIKEDNNKIKVEMMHQEYKDGTKYFKTDNEEGIILPYQVDDSSYNLEFIGIIPKNGVTNYINNLSDKTIANIDNNLKSSSNSLQINLSLPRFTYNYSIDNLKDVLKDLGIKEAFDDNKADFSNIIDNKKLYVSSAIHKTRIELNETGTKAAAVTFFGIEAYGLIEKNYEEVDINFNKPFIYLIREKNTGEILFFGTVFEPNIWHGTTCSEE